MSLLGNIIWLVFGGFFAALGYILGGLVLCLTIIGIPFGIQSIKLGFTSMAPFGKDLVSDQNSGDVLHVIFNLIWLVLFGWEIAMLHLGSAAILAITIVGILTALALPSFNNVVAIALPSPFFICGENSISAPANVNARLRKSCGASEVFCNTFKTSFASNAGPMPLPTGCVPSEVIIFN